MKILIPNDITPSITKEPVKQKIKNLLKAIGFRPSPHGQKQAKSFFPILYAVPKSIQRVLVAIEPAPKRPIDYIHINGKKAVFTQLTNDQYILDSSFFYSYENIVSLPQKYSISKVSLFPIIDDLKQEEITVLTRQYTLKDTVTGTKTYKTGTLDLNVHKDVSPLYSCIFNAQITCDNTPFKGLYYPAFDLPNRSYRLSSWVWTNSVLVKLFIEEAKLSNNPAYAQRAKELTDRILYFQSKSGDEAGSFMARWDIFDNSPRGINPQYSTNDSAFIGAYALIPAFEYFGDRKYLDSAVKIGHWIQDKGMGSDGQLYMGIDGETGSCVDNHLFVDAGFTQTLFAALYRTTKDPSWLKPMEKFTEWFIKIMFLPGKGYFARNWYSDGRVDSTIFLRGQAWAMDGLLACYEATKAAKYLQILMQMVNTLSIHQAKEGAWYHFMDRASSGCCSKGTPIIVYHLTRLLLITEDDALLELIRKALTWCKESVWENDSDPRALGGVFGKSIEGTMYGPRNIDCIFMYGIAYYRLTIQLLRNHNVL